MALRQGYLTTTSKSNTTLDSNWAGTSSNDVSTACGLAGFGFVLALIVQLVPSQWLTFDMDVALADLDKQLASLQSRLGLAGEGLSITGVARGVIAVFAALVLATFSGPALRFSYTFVNLHKIRFKGRFTSFLMYADIVLSLLIFVSFFRPVLLNWLQAPRGIQACVGADTEGGAEGGNQTCSAQASAGMAGLLPPSDDVFLAGQLAATCLVLLLRAVLARWQLQTFLEFSAIESVRRDLMRKDADPSAIQWTFTLRRNLLVGVALQYLAPIVWLACLVLLIAVKHLYPPVGRAMLESLDPVAAATLAETLAAREEALRNGTTIMAKTRIILDFPVISPLFYQHVVGFLLWWSVGAYVFLYLFYIVYRATQYQPLVVIGPKK
jgi:hypothetical protein